MTGPTRQHRHRVSASALKARVDDTRRQLEARRRTSRTVDAVFGLADAHTAAGGELLAGAIAFRFFLFIVPCVFVVVFGLGLGADAAGANVQDMARRAGIAGIAATAIQSGAPASDLTRWFTFAAAVFAMILGARHLLRALRVAHALIWRVRPQKLRHQITASLVLVVGLAVAIALLRVVYVVRSLSFVGWLFSLALYTAVPTALWLACSVKLFPKPQGVAWVDLLPGAVLFGVGIHGLHLVTVLWLAHSIESKSQAYGAIGAALGILLWAYLLGRIVTSAAALNAALWHRSHPSQHPIEAIEQRLGQ